jgi:hypothetical protein
MVRHQDLHLGITMSNNGCSDCNERLAESLKSTKDQVYKLKTRGAFLDMCLKTASKDLLYIGRYDYLLEISRLYLNSKNSGEENHFIDFISNKFQ